MSAATLDAWTRRFRRGGEVGHRNEWIASLRAGAVLERVAEVAPEALDDFHDDPDRPDVRVAGDEFWRAFARAIADCERVDSQRARNRPRDDWGWGELIATPISHPDREKVALRLCRKYLHHKLPRPMVLAMLLVHNTAMFAPPLDPAEVETLWRWCCDQHDEGRER